MDAHILRHTLRAHLHLPTAMSLRRCSQWLTQQFRSRIAVTRCNSTTPKHTKTHQNNRLDLGVTSQSLGVTVQHQNNRLDLGVTSQSLGVTVQHQNNRLDLGAMSQSLGVTVQHQNTPKHTKTID